MSWQAMVHVLEHSTATHSARLVVLSLASHADAEGRNAYPSIATLAHQTRLGESTIRAGLEWLKDAGEVVEDGLGPRRTRRFHLLLDPAGSAGVRDLRPRSIRTLEGAVFAPLPPQILRSDPAGSAPEQSLNEEKKKESASATATNGLHPAFDEAVAMLRSAPGLEVEPAAVNSALSLRADVDPMEAVRMVVAWAHGGGLAMKSASRLLHAANRNLATDAARRDGIRDAAATTEARRGQKRTTPAEDERSKRRRDDTEALNALMGTVT